MTWNIKNFPLSDNTVEAASEIILDLLPDIINFQEINSNSAFDDLKVLLSVYDFIDYATDEYYGLAIAYRKDCLENIDNTTLFEDYSWEFTYRYPLSANFMWSCGESYIIFEMVNVHLKCCDNGFDQRLEAAEILSDYVNYQTEQNKNIIIAGDYNDSLDDDINNNSLLPLINNQNISFVDYSIAIGSSLDWSYPSWPSHIDHILINSNLFQNLIEETITIKLDDYVGYNYYQNNLSDHRPVMTKIIIN